MVWFWKSAEQIKKAEDEERAKGYNWAAGELLRGRKASDISESVNAATPTGTYSAFHAGMHDAIKRFQYLLRCMTPAKRKKYKEANKFR